MAETQSFSNPGIVVTSVMAVCAHAGTSTSLPGSVTFDEGHAIIPTPKLKHRWCTKRYEKDRER